MIVEMEERHIPDVGGPEGEFAVIGRIVPRFENDVWTYEERLNPVTHTKRYPGEAAQYARAIDDPDRTAYLYYDGSRCVGRIRLRVNWNRYAFIEDIAVSEPERGRGIGTALMSRAAEWAKERGLGGIMLETQDNNVLACRFYRRQGMTIGAVDTMLYANTPYAGESALFWYRKF
ncbi:MAG: GNAT family N-acetyltransferase [Clostridiales bacterium]|nr:GNAT family N-acetyltransferase [Clostridiales bacterium]